MPSLTRTEAARRGARLSVHRYRIDLDLDRGDETFGSSTVIEFDAEAGTDTFLDLAPAGPTDLVDRVSVTLNGTVLDPAGLAGGRFPLPALAASNTVEVRATMAYSRQGEGLHRYRDPADGAVYVYGFAYVDHSPKVYACFDQPDLKATFEFTVTTPDDGWQVLGTGTPQRLSARRWRLISEGPQATYLTTVLAGPWTSFHRRHGAVELGVHCRASLAGALKTELDEILEVTGQALDACADLFGTAYGFSKLDQVFVPEFGLLSLDHPGCVLLREQYLLGPAVAMSERETRAVVLAHGISLMWLAGLVTHAWWDDYWLSQTFADYIAHRITAQATRFPDPPVTFAVRRKAQALVQDQRPSTHPVAVSGPDVHSVLLQMDRITYFKGHSVLRQLVATIGDERLRAGLQTYFARHAHGTATFEDFMAALETAAGRSLRPWAQAWLTRADVNTLTPRLELRDGRISSFAIRQDAPPAHPVLRPHTLGVGLYRRTADGGVHRDVVTVDVDGPITLLPQLEGRPAPDLVLVNDGDLTYAKIRFEAASTAALPDLLSQLSPLNRAMVWGQLLMAVMDGELAASAYLELVVGMLAVENQLPIVIEVLEQARGDVADSYLAPGLRPAALAAVAGALRERLARTEPGDELGIALFRGLVVFSADPGELAGHLTGEPAAVPLDAELAWRIRYRLAGLGALDQAGIDAAAAAEPSGLSQEWAARCRAARPDPESKAACWLEIMHGHASNYELWALAEGFWQPEQSELLASYPRRFFTELPAAAEGRGDLVLDLLIRFLYPRHAADRDTLQLAAGLLAAVPQESTLARRIADHTDDLRRLIEVRERA